jgi:hypothetical protein
MQLDTPSVGSALCSDTNLFGASPGRYVRRHSDIGRITGGEIANLGGMPLVPVVGLLVQPNHLVRPILRGPGSDGGRTIEATVANTGQRPTGSS